MKKKNLLKKLSLNKQTIANISDDELNDVRGGTVAQEVSITKFIFRSNNYLGWASTDTNQP